MYFALALLMYGDFGVGELLSDFEFLTAVFTLVFVKRHFAYFGPFGRMGAGAEPTAGVVSSCAAVN
jgi:hypothetical protein